MNLKPGEIICPKCEANHIVGKGKLTIWGCDKCKGYGKVDWIEAVVGKKRITKIEMFCKPIITATQIPTNYIYDKPNPLTPYLVDYIDLIKP